jgi:hypothetical protein
VVEELVHLHLALSDIQAKRMALATNIRRLIHLTFKKKPKFSRNLDR